MKAKHLSLTIVALLAAAGLWLARSAWRTHASHKSNIDVDFKTPDGPPEPDQMLNSPARPMPPNPNRKFEKLTPEERVQLARRGPIGG